MSFMSFYVKQFAFQSERPLIAPKIIDRETEVSFWNSKY